MRLGRIGPVLVGICLLAVSVAPAAAAPDAPQQAVCRALAWLEAQQGPDGSFGFHLANGAYQPSASVTADAVYALAQLGEKPDGVRWTRGGRSAVAALAVLAPGYVGMDAGQAGKVARAVALAGADPRAFAGMDLVAIIEAAYAPATGRYHPALLFRHTLAVEGLLRSGSAVPQAAFDALRSAQLADGGWFWSFDGMQSDVDTTGRVVALLAGEARIPAPEAYGRAAALLAQMQADGGGWGVDVSSLPNSNSTALAVNALAAAGVDLQAPEFQRQGRGVLETLLSFQEDAGAFVYIRQPGKEEVRLMATLDALVTLAPLVAGQPACSAVASERRPVLEDNTGPERPAAPVTGIYLPLILVL